MKLGAEKKPQQAWEVQLMLLWLVFFPIENFPLLNKAEMKRWQNSCYSMVAVNPFYSRNVPKSFSIQYSILLALVRQANNMFVSVNIDQQMGSTAVPQVDFLWVIQTVCVGQLVMTRYTLKWSIQNCDPPSRKIHQNASIGCCINSKQKSYYLTSIYTVTNAGGQHNKTITERPTNHNKKCKMKCQRCQSWET